MIKKIDHLVLTTGDPERLIFFYHALGFVPNKDGERIELWAGDFKINVHTLGKELLPHARFIQPGSGDLCFELAEPLDSFLERLNQRGIEVELCSVPRSGAKGVMTSIYLRDPDGNLIEFCSYSV